MPKSLGRLVSIAAGTAFTFVIISCGLFPSFDDLEQTELNRGDGSSGSSGSNADAPSTPDTGGGTTEDGSPPVGPREIKCNLEICKLPEQYCCLTAGGLLCRPIDGPFGGIGNCKIQNIGFGKSYTCDGEEDCAPGQVCCFNEDDENGVNAKCRPTCDTGKSLCNGPTEKCPDGKTCSGTLPGGIKVCQP